MDLFLEHINETEMLTAGDCDIVFEAGGRPKLITGLLYLAQAVGKVALSVLGTHAIDPDYGSVLYSWVGKKMPKFVQFTYMRQSLLDSILHFRALQQQAGRTDQSELLRSLSRFSLQKSELDPRQAEASIDVVNMEGESNSLLVPVGA